ncbi:MAG: cupredoxin domain-containing protein [Anaerolineae bacterium]
MKHKGLCCLAISVMLMLVLAACGQSGGAAPSGEITITMTEESSDKYLYKPDTIRVKAGQEVRITLVNKGEKDHEFMVGRNVMMMGDQPSGFMMDFFEGIEVKAERGGQPIALSEVSGHEEAAESEHGHEAEEAEHEHEAEMDHGTMVLVYEGDEAVTITFTVPEDKVGEWEIGCFQDDGDHWGKGMQGKLIVQK